VYMRERERDGGGRVCLLSKETQILLSSTVHCLFSFLYLSLLVHTLFMTMRG
jgi:hypothetical protein